jgi:hypothetical protein
MVFRSKDGFLWRLRQIFLRTLILTYHHCPVLAIKAPKISSFNQRAGLLDFAVDGSENLPKAQTCSDECQVSVKNIYQIKLDLFRLHFLVFRPDAPHRTAKASSLDEKSLRFLFGIYFCPDTQA